MRWLVEDERHVPIALCNRLVRKVLKRSVDLTFSRCGSHVAADVATVLPLVLREKTMKEKGWLS